MISVFSFLSQHRRNSSSGISALALRRRDDPRRGFLRRTGNKLVPRRAAEPPSTHGHGARRRRGGVGSVDVQGRARGLQPPPPPVATGEVRRKKRRAPLDGKAFLRRYTAQLMICPSTPIRAEDPRSGSFPPRSAAGGREQHPLSPCRGSGAGRGMAGKDGPAAAPWLCLAQTQVIPVHHSGGMRGRGVIFFFSNSVSFW